MILIFTPAETAQGGIANYYQVLKKKFSLNVDYFVRGARTLPYKKGFLLELIRAYRDYHKFCQIANSKSYKLVQTSTSLSLYSLIRDGLFVRAAKKRGIKVIVFFRGWHNNAEKLIENGWLWVFKWLFWKTDAAIVLSKKFEAKLYDWGYKQPVFIETTVADEDLLKGFKIEEKIKKLKQDHHLNILFLARMEKEKGIYEIIDMYRRLKKEFLDISLTMAGDGTELERIREITRGIPDVLLPGKVFGKVKSDLLAEANIYVLPSFHGEGIPNSILEALSFGLPVVTTRVGGIPEIIKEGENGFLVPEKNSSALYEVVKKLMNRELIAEIGMRNYKIAQEKFVTKVVVKRLENIFKQVIEMN